MYMSLTQLAQTLSMRVRLASESHIAALNGLAVPVHLSLGTSDASHWLPTGCETRVAQLCSIIPIMTQREIQHWIRRPVLKTAYLVGVREPKLVLGFRLW
jgi:hypothetical protein